MRTIRQRRKQAEFEGGDLRGFGNDPLLTDSAPFACLTVETTNAPMLEELCAKYRLERVEASVPHHKVTAVQMWHRTRKDGEHKLQAIELLGAATEILAQDPHNKCVLHEIKQLHRRLSGFDPEVDQQLGLSAGVAQLQSLREGHLRLVEPTPLYLCQAGLAVNASYRQVDISRTELGKMLAAARDRSPVAPADRKAG